MAFLNSSTSRAFELLSSAILNFLPIPAIPLAPLAAIFFLMCSRSCASVAFLGTPTSSAAAVLAWGLPKMLLSCLALG